MFKGFRVELNICHSPITWRDTLVWDIETFTCVNPEEVTELIGNLFKGHFEDGTYIKIYCINEDGTEKPLNVSGIKYKDWNGFHLHYENGNLVYGTKCTA